MKIIEATYKDGTTTTQTSTKRMTKTQVLNAIKDLLEKQDVVEITIKEA